MQSSLLSFKNDLKYNHCPLCRSISLLKKGNISYKSPVRYSTTEVELEITPELWKCSECNSFFTQNRVHEKDSIMLYSNGSSQQRWSSSQKSFKNLKPENQIHVLNKYLLSGKKILDIGCNTGELLDYAKSRGCITTGVEYSKQSREALKRKNHATYLSTTDINEHFDVITVFDLVEHLYDIPGFFIDCKRLLKETGVLIILTGNIDSITAKLCGSNWWYLRFPEHVVFPSKKFFTSHTGMKLDSQIKTYASNNLDQGWFKVLRGLIAGLIKRNYGGFPSAQPDHHLLIIKKL